MKEKSKIKKAASSAHRHSFKLRPCDQYKELYVQLFQVFKNAREKGYHVNFGWLWSKARKIYKRRTGDDNTSIRKHVVVNFIKRFNIRMRAKQRNRKLSKESYCEALMKWHATTRDRLIRAGKDDTYDET